MLTIQEIRADIDLARKRLEIKNFAETELLEKAVSLDDKRRSLQAEHDTLLAESNKMAKQIGALMSQGKKDEAEAAKVQTAELKRRSKELSEEQQKVGSALKDVLLTIPNFPHDSVPGGNSEDDNEVVREGGKKPALHKGALPHWELADKYNLIDFELGVKITGAGFPVYKGKGARLQRALINYFLDSATKEGYTEFIPGMLANEASAYGTGQLPDKEGQMYHVTADDLYLIPTAEVPLTNIYRDTIIKEDDFPVKMTAYTSCFRREAGSYGKHVRGLNRLHQFEKIEIVQLAHPSGSYSVLDEMVAYVEKLVQSLGLPYRILRLCGGDLSFASALTFDFEVWSAGQERWLEVSSVSNFETFQSNRLKLRYADSDNKKHLAHTLNGSALALPRIVAALLENYQEQNGIRIPEILQPYTGFELIS